MDRLELLCKQYSFENPADVKEIIADAFSKKLFAVKPQAFQLIRALSLARTYLATNDLDAIIKWAKQ